MTLAAASDGTMTAPAAERNLIPIMDALVPELPERGAFLELGSGTGQHVQALAAAAPHMTFHPTDPEPDRRAAIDARCHDLPNVRPARDLDAGVPRWADGLRAQAIYAANVLHLISDAELAVLLDEAAKALDRGGLLAFYGPFLRDGGPVSPSDDAFDAALREQDPAIGLKDVAMVETVLGTLGLSVRRVPMPANNLLVLARHDPRP
ncbi:DUF938 domain-containing protein [Jannaschia sp. LMIT008]|uniref:DUF938 domain-containing protein n=1 Tax=Jannaschia maritima TaxID=3032585 RepID=UPI002810FDCE|nr:DUF938 domain-containing protein [Jannaschia sp. LMIT008]